MSFPSSENITAKTQERAPCQSQEHGAGLSGRAAGRLREGRQRAGEDRAGGSRLDPRGTGEPREGSRQRSEMPDLWFNRVAWWWCEDHSGGGQQSQHEGGCRNPGENSRQDASLRSEEGLMGGVVSK